MQKINMVVSVVAAFGGTIGAIAYGIIGLCAGVAITCALIILAPTVSLRVNRVLNGTIDDELISLFYASVFMFVALAGICGSFVKPLFKSDFILDQFIVGSAMSLATVLMIAFACHGINMVVKIVARSYGVSKLRALFAAVPIVGILGNLNRQPAAA